MNDKDLNKGIVPLNQNSLPFSVELSTPWVVAESKKVTEEFLRQKTIKVSGENINSYWSLKELQVWDYTITCVDVLAWISWKKYLYKVLWNTYVEVEFYDSQWNFLDIDKDITECHWMNLAWFSSHSLFDNKFSWSKPYWEIENNEAFKLTIDPVSIMILDWDGEIPLQSLESTKMTTLLSDLLDISWISLWTDVQWWKHLVIFDWNTSLVEPITILAEWSWEWDVFNLATYDIIDHYVWRRNFGETELFAFIENQITSKGAIEKLDNNKFLLKWLKTDWWKKIQKICSSSFVYPWDDASCVSTTQTDEWLTHILSRWLDKWTLDEVKLKTFHAPGWYISQNLEDKWVSFNWKVFQLVEITWPLADKQKIFLEPGVKEIQPIEWEEWYKEKYWLQEAQMILETNWRNGSIVWFLRDKMACFTLWIWDEAVRYTPVSVSYNWKNIIEKSYVDFENVETLSASEWLDYDPELSYHLYFFKERILFLELGEWLNDVTVDHDTFSEAFPYEDDWCIFMLQKFILRRWDESINIIVNTETRKPFEIERNWNTYFLTHISDDQKTCSVVSKYDWNDIADEVLLLE